MGHWKRVACLAFAMFCVAGNAAWLAGAFSQVAPHRALAQAKSAIRQGNSKVAVDLLKPILGNENAESSDVASALSLIEQCYSRLRDDSSMDSALKLATQTHASEPIVLQQAAKSLLKSNSYGRIVDQKFERGYGRGGFGRRAVRMVNVTELDRRQALAWLVQAVELTGADTPKLRAEIHLQLATTLLHMRDRKMSWLLQVQSDLDSELNYSRLDRPDSPPGRNPPVDAEGKPHTYPLQKTWAAAENDGQRLRFCLAQADEHPSTKTRSKQAWADFLNGQFAVTTLRQFAWMRRQSESVDTAENRFALHTLADDEYLANLAAGVKRFTLPDDYGPIRIYESLAAEFETQQAAAHDASWKLAQIYLNRRQYSTAASWMQKCIERFGDDGNDTEQKQLDAIREPRITIDPAQPLLADKSGELSLVFRNTSRIALTARKVDIEKILADTKKFYKNFRSRGGYDNPFKNQPPNLQQPQDLFNTENVQNYLTDTTHSWEIDVQSRDNHWDKRQRVATPEMQGGLYLIDAIADAKHRSRTLVWVQDLVLVKKVQKRNTLYIVVDAATGQAVPGAQLEFLGIKNVHNQSDNSSRYVVENFAANTDRQGQAYVGLKSQMQWTAIARSESGQLALLGADGFWGGQPGIAQFDNTLAYGVSDRPAYRPGDSASIKLWLARATYGNVAAKNLAGISVRADIFDPQNNKIASHQLKTDKFGGCDADIRIPASAALGRYRVEVHASVRSRKLSQLSCGLAFRVEEYRKPEFEVEIIAPSKPVALGATVKPTIRARYLWGGPVAGATATVKVERANYSDQFYPAMPYDWCYGAGYWWTAEKYDWLPGWDQWSGCQAFGGGWNPWSAPEPKELIWTREIILDREGEAEIAIDTAIAKELYGDADHKYTIEVEVRDASRRTLSATGSIIAAREAFKIYTWTDRGFYSVGQAIGVSAQARQLDDTPVPGPATVELRKLNYAADGTSTESVVAETALAADASGNIDHKFAAQASGQYRIVVRMRDADGNAIEGGYVFTVRGEDRQDADFRYAALELIPDQKSYQPGDVMQLHVASNYPGARVAVFQRPESGVYGRPTWIDLNGKSSVIEIPITDADLPNFFVEAFAVFDGELHSVVRDVTVPPSKKTLQVEITADKDEYLPGEEATIEVSVRDANGNPVEGSCLIAAYDRALDQIAPGVLPRDIREAFWKWSRQHSASQLTSIVSSSYPIFISGVPQHTTLGAFGGSLADDGDLGLKSRMRRGGGGMAGMGGFGGGGMAEMAMSSPMSFDMADDAAGSMPGEGGANSQVAKVRKDFADAAVWVAAITTGPDGKVSKTFKMPENLTGWRIRSWAVASEVRVGSGDIRVVTRKPLSVRLALPRFVIEGDQATFSTIVQNDFATTQNVSVRLEIDGETELAMTEGQSLVQSIEVQSGDSARLNWSVDALAAGKVAVRAIATAADGSDAVQIELPVEVYGLLKTDSYAGTVRAGQASSRVAISVPEERQVEHSRLVVRVSPSLAASMVDALPYLIEYPYGCTEQTLNRFLPAAITRQTLTQLGVDLERLNKPRNNLNAQEVDASLTSRMPHQNNPVFDSKRLDEIVTKGVRRLTDMQLSDGGWGWFSGMRERSSPHTTATVLRGLLIARNNGVAIVPSVIQRGSAWMEAHVAGRLALLTVEKPKTSVSNLDALCLYTLALNDKGNAGLQDLLFQKRNKLTSYGLSLLAMVAHHRGNVAQRQMLRQNVEQFLVEDAENETAYIQNTARYWYWHGSGIETNAMYLKLLSAVDPKGRVAPRIVKYLLNNRAHATYWDNTRDTSLVVEAMGDYLRATGEANQPSSVEVYLGGKRLGRVSFTPENMFSVNNTIEIHGRALPAGMQNIEIRRTGGGNLYWNAYITNFTQEKKITPAGLELKVKRRHYLLTPSQDDMNLPGATANVVDAKHAGFTRTLLANGDAIPSGSQVEVELIVESKNDYSYILIEDHKPACLEAVDTQSGYMSGGGLRVYRELREQHVGLCIQTLPLGKHVIRYRLRSETPGTFVAPPATIQGMYATELVGNSANLNLRVRDQ